MHYGRRSRGEQGTGGVDESLDIAVVVRAVGFGHVHLAHRQSHAVDHVSARGHALVYAVQTLRLLETVDLVLRRKATDGYEEEKRRAVTNCA